MWGCLFAAAIAFPLVFGWLSFESIPSRIATYRILIFGFPTIVFPSGSWAGFVIFHGLVWSTFLVIAGVMLAVRRRVRDEGAVALQLFAEDFLPLLLLFAVSITGLLLPDSVHAVARITSPLRALELVTPLWLLIMGAKDRALAA